MDVLDAVNRRMSVRAFKTDPVDGSLLRELLEAAARAPSGGNLQPWRVQAITGGPLAALRATMLQRVASPDTPQYDVYPANLWEPLRSRRFQVGEDMYGALGIPREDKLARLQWFASNGQSFGAPVVLFFSVDRRCGPPQWSDLGMYMQTLMLLAVERGLDTCAQEFWSHYHQVVHDHVGLPDSHMLFSGMALGYRDEGAAVNSWRSRRDSFEAWGEMRGFE
ncbi:nitroreductase [Caulobacter sp. DWR1-3-2b1]|uniref:nitroreductase n=1 Tax=Caulobacter sp. DWR1-3-2b1 TaxID=2804670 RepID=UPI003CE8BC99